MFTNYVNLSSLFVKDLHRKGVAIDCDISVSNIVFNFEDAGEIQSIRYITIDNNELRKTFQDIYNDIFKENKFKIYITGFRKVWAKAIVEQVHNGDIIMIEEMQSIFNGFNLLSDHINIPDIEVKAVEMIERNKQYKFDEKNPIIEKLRQAMRFSGDEIETDSNKFHTPSIIVTANSIFNIFLMKNDKSIESLNTSYNGSMTLKGLSKCLINLNKMEEIITMANDGNRESVDTQVYEIFSDDNKSPYGKLPPNIPIFSFGKSADYNKNVESFEQNDVMESLCNLVMVDLINIIIPSCKAFRIKTVYIFGPLFNNSTFAKLLYNRSKIIPGNIEMKILNCDYLLAMGALKS